MARDFPGNGGDYLTASSLVVTSVPIISVSAWFYADSVAQYKNIWSMEAGAQDIRLEFDDGWGWVFAYPWSTPGAAKWSISKPATGSWKHLLITYDSSSTSNDPIYYLDGASQTVTERVTPAGTATTTISNVRIGSSQSDTQRWDGRIAEFAMWNRTLSSSEALILSKAFSPLFIPNGLTMYAPLIGRASPEIEIRHGANFTVTGDAVNIAHPRIIYPSHNQSRRFTTASGAPSTLVKDIIGGFGFIPFAR